LVRNARLIVVLVATVLFLDGAKGAIAQTRQERIDRELRQAACAPGMGWSEVCAVEDYNPRSQAITTALDRAEYSAAPRTKSTPVATTPVDRVHQQSVKPGVASSPPAAAEVVVSPAAPVAEPLVEKKSAAAEPSNVVPDHVVKPEPETLVQRYFDISRPENSLEAGLEVFDYSYREEGLMKLDGQMYGAFVNYSHRYYENPIATGWGDIFKSEGKINILLADARISGGGNIKYRSEGTGIHEGENHYAFETRIMAGYEIPWKSPDLVFTPYAGFGYRYLLDDNGGTQTTTGHWGYDRESNYYYVPIGISMAQCYRNGWSTKTTLEYDWFIRGVQKSHHEDVPGSALGELSFEQPRGYGARGSFQVLKEGDRFDVFAEPFVRYWHIEDSGVDSGRYEPNNRTEEYGARMGFRF
ncbi:MAG TPA: hypothetical protein VLL97_05515, partial [Acidobacteriota bacterium]|nr:hypothetical protein [Acidobacteriota bacterium]